MEGLGSRWAGRAYGTNTGNIFVEFDPAADRPNGVLRFNDSELGLAIYNVEGQFASGKIELVGTPVPRAGVELGNLTIVGRLDSKGQIVGDWSSSLGTAGTFVLFPHDRPQEGANGPDRSALGEQLHTATRKVGALRFYADDVRQLIDVLRRDFGQSTRVVVTYRSGGTEVSRYVDDFTRDFEQIGRLNYLKLNISEPEVAGLNRTLTLELNGAGENLVTTQSVQASWAVGKAEGVAAHLKQYEKPLATSFRQFGLNINAIILLFTMVALPDLKILQRFIFLAFVIVLIQIIARIHSRHIPNVVVFLRAQRPSWMQRSGPQIMSWVVAATSTAVASIVYGLLKGEVNVPTMIENLVKLIR